MMELFRSSKSSLGPSPPGSIPYFLPVWVFILHPSLPWCLRVFLPQLYPCRQPFVSKPQGHFLKATWQPVWSSITCSSQGSSQHSPKPSPFVLGPPFPCQPACWSAYNEPGQFFFIWSRGRGGLFPLLCRLQTSAFPHISPSVPASPLGPIPPLSKEAPCYFHHVNCHQEDK